MIVTSLHADSLPDLRYAIRRAVALGTDIVELRMDLMPSLDPAAILTDKPCAVMVTVRSRDQGGAYRGDESSRLTLLQKAADRGTDYIDWEYTSAHEIDRKSSRLVVSMHTQESYPSEWDRFLEKTREVRADFIKVAATPRSSAGAIRLMDLARTSSTRGCFIPMGPWGEAARVLYKKFGNAWTYAALEKGRETAPGQVALEEMVSFYRASRIGETTRVFAVIGNPVAHSRSPEVFNDAFRRLGMDAVYVRIPMDDSVTLRHAVESYGLAGASVTVPHKAAAVPACDEIDPSARAIGAVNTLVVSEGRVKGYNTDGEAAVEAIETGGPVRGKNILVLGAGGTARAVVACLVRAGARVSIANRTVEKAQKLAEEFRCVSIATSDMYRASWDVVVNATSVGMTPNGNESPVEARMFRKGMAVFDVVYTPPVTRFLREAQEAGAMVVGGQEMFLRQAARQFRLFTGHELPPESGIIRRS